MNDLNEINQIELITQEGIIKLKKKQGKFYNDKIDKLYDDKDILEMYNVGLLLINGEK